MELAADLVEGALDGVLELLIWGVFVVADLGMQSRAVPRFPLLRAE